MQSILSFLPRLKIHLQAPLCLWNDRAAVGASLDALSRKAFIVSYLMDGVQLLVLMLVLIGDH
jgi:hypothetical protein